MLRTPAQNHWREAEIAEIQGAGRLDASNTETIEKLVQGDDKRRFETLGHSLREPVRTDLRVQASPCERLFFLSHYGQEAKSSERGSSR